MKDFRGLKIIGSVDQQEILIERIEKLLNDGWTRDRHKEIEYESSYKAKYKIFACSNLRSRPAAELFLIADENDYLYVCQIIIKEIGEVKSDRSALLDEFQNKFIEPAAKGLDIQIITTPAEKTIDNSMSPDIARLLKRFSAAANKSGIHSCDEQRFFDFIIKAHEEDSLLNESQLGELLIEDGWSDENAFELSCKYRFGRDLLKHQSQE